METDSSDQIEKGREETECAAKEKYGEQERQPREKAADNKKRLEAEVKDGTCEATAAKRR
jgi:hypothetical protein